MTFICKFSRKEITSKFLITFLILISFCEARAQSDAEINPRLFFENSVFRKNIFTVLLHREGAELSSPSIELGAQTKLQLRFDDLDGDDKTLSYTFIHCTSDWEPSDLFETDYMVGYLDERITDIRYSFNTNQRYTHYTVTFPNENIGLSKSGNYIIKVYSDYERKNVVLTRRFMIFENQLDITTDIHRATGISDMKSKQELDFVVNYERLKVLNPFEELKIVIQQNDRWDNAIRGLKPIFVRDRELVYDFEDENTFNGGSEFREFDFRSTRFNTERVDEITYEVADTAVGLSGEKFLHVYLENDEKRSWKSYYSSKSDLNGKFLISSQDRFTESANTEADYGFIHFSVPLSEEISHGTLHVSGALNDWKCTEENRLTYNFTKKMYECSLFVKQGYYNYTYFVKNFETGNYDATFMEGNHSETENSYTLYVYQRGFGSRYDRLVGIKFLNSSSTARY